MAINNIEIKMFKNLPPEVRTQITDLNGNSVDFDNINPFSLVCVELTGNPYELVSASLLSENQTTYDFFKFRAEQTGFDIDRFIKIFGEKKGHGR